MVTIVRHGEALWLELPSDLATAFQCMCRRKRYWDDVEALAEDIHRCRQKGSLPL